MKQEIDFDQFYDMKTVSTTNFSHLQTAKSMRALDKLYTMKSLDVSASRPESLIRGEIKLWERLRAMEFKPKGIPHFTGFSKSKQKNSFNLVFDVPPKTLKDFLEEQKARNPGEAVSFYQLRLAFESAVKTMAFLQTMKICCVEVKPENLLFDPASNQIYIIDPAASKESITKANAESKKVFAISGSSAYFPPEIDNAMSNPSLEFNLHKADVFSLAIVVLELGTFQVPSKIYGASQWKESIDGLLKRFREGYKASVQSPEGRAQLDDFLRLLRGCLSFDPDERPDFIDLFLSTMRNIEHERLRMHILLEEEILNLEHLRNLETMRGKDFSFVGSSKDQSVDVKIWGKAVNFLDKDSFLDEEDLKNSLRQIKPIMDLHIETLSKKDPKDIEPSAYFFNQNVFPMDYFDYRKIKRFSFLCVPHKKIITHPAEKYWHKMFFEKRVLEKLCTSQDVSQDEEMLRDQGKSLSLKHSHECEWFNE